jgi:hypothetical protein
VSDRWLTFGVCQRGDADGLHPRDVNIEGRMFRRVSKHPVRYALVVAILAFVVITVVKTRQGEWFSFR